MNKTELEVCCGDVESVDTAAKAGAERIELCSALAEGGVTPSEGLIRHAVRSGIRRVNVLIRPRGGDFLYTPEEVDVMVADVRAARRLGAAGVVIGALRPDGSIDTEAMSRMIEEAEGMEVVCHRAFDMARDRSEALETLISMGVNRILTSGGAASAPEGAAELRRLREQADGRIIIMAGSGVTPDNAARLVEESGVQAVHSTASAMQPSKMEWRNDGVNMGAKGADEYARKTTSAEVLRRLMAVLPALLMLIMAIPAVAKTYEREALLERLYAGMPGPDSVSYSRDFYLANVDASIRAAREMPWGDRVPEKEFIHFVLPVRVNNEALDMSRPAFYEELAPRVKGMNMTDAALEVNHWCHEKVTYRPSDGRTSSPLSSVSQAIGRCGEESTFTVSALRSVGIPARQIYTPRWAHTDDNHAWVEVWTDGEWHFLGACEPEPVLDLAWFNLPASRGMMMNTKVAGSYPGPEEILETTPVTTMINVTSNYAPVRTATVEVVDEKGRPVEDATVDFCLYNYAEFYKLATKKSDARGKADLLCGLGDMMVWASKDGRFGMAHSKGNDRKTRVVLRRPEKSGDYDLVPPAASTKLVKPTAAQIAANARRLAYEDSVRMAYTATFLDAEKARAAAQALGMDAERLGKVLVESRGNHARLTEYLATLTPEKKAMALRLLEAVSEKDRRDIPVDVIEDNISNTPARPTGISEADYDAYVLSPRVMTEGLVPYKGWFARHLPQNLRMEWQSNPASLRNWLLAKMEIRDALNPAGIKGNPVEEFKARKADMANLPIIFVAIARSMGIPARVDAVTGKTQYMRGGEWQDVIWKKATETKAAPRGRVAFAYTPTDRIPDPKYYSQFTISRIDDGRMQLLEYDEETPLSSFAGENGMLDAGDYMLVTGQRLANGTVLAHTEFFRIDEGKTTEVPLTIRHDDSAVQVIGSLNAEDLYYDEATGTDKSILSTTGRGYYALSILKPSHEPTAHALNDISLVAKDFDRTGMKLLLLFESESDMERFDRAAFKSLPENTVFGIDTDGKIMKELAETLHIPADEYPLTVIADTFNRVVFLSQGYTIRLGETLMDTIKKL